MKAWHIILGYNAKIFLFVSMRASCSHVEPNRCLWLIQVWPCMIWCVIIMLSAPSINLPCRSKLSCVDSTCTIHSHSIALNVIADASGLIFVVCKQSVYKMYRVYTWYLITRWMQCIVGGSMSELYHVFIGSMVVTYLLSSSYFYNSIFLFPCRAISCDIAQA